MTRKKDKMREIKFTINYIKNTQGSVLAEFGDTKVLCNAMIENKVPPFLKNTGKGWLTAEYAMLPQAGNTRKTRDSVKGKVDGRSQEIQRLIGRTLRQAVDIENIGEKTIWIDCDVLQADGGTRTCAISGGFIAICLALKNAYDKKEIDKYPIKNYISSVSVGVVNDKEVLDLDFKLDSNAMVDMNVVMTDKNEFVEIQGTGEKRTFNGGQLQTMLDLAQKGIEEIIIEQKKALGEEITSLIEKYRSTGNEEKIEIVLATGNKNKIKNFREILDETKYEIKTIEDYGIQDLEIEESGATFEENSLIKAKEYSKRIGKTVISDDSGLEVEYLNGNPGVYSKRYAGENATDEDNIKKLKKELSGTLSSQRNAKFVCVITMYKANGEYIQARGESNGYIAFEEKGENGFGYDPLFISFEDNYDKLTFAQMKPEEKNKRSHRTKALKKLKEELEK